MSDTVKKYGIATLASGTTVGLVLLLWDILHFVPDMLFAIPVVLISRYAGRGPSVLTIFLSVMAVAVMLFITTGPSGHTFAELLFHAGLFAVVAFVINSSTEALRKAHRDAERSAAHLEDLNVELEQQMEEIQTLSEDLQRTNESLAAALDTAVDASRAREEVLAVVAHDLRSPLNLVVMTTQLLADGEIPKEKCNELLAIIQRAARRMNRLIEDLLEIVRQESGRIALDFQDTSAAYLLAQTTEIFQPAAMEKGVSLRVTDAPSGLDVWADAERIVQVMSNLVGNALKFVPRGGSIVLKCEKSGTEAIFSVTDSGLGITPEDLHKLFEKFWQRRGTDKRGIGLGLTIAKGIVEAHAGRIWAESRVGVGSTFYFSLPVMSQDRREPVLAGVNPSLVGNIPAETVA